ncbi:protein tyrosine phosphatase [Loigolactobacillus backii]|uniref:Protein tyrosine phosphatase n=1 Tax=Loigolactobacillus backii TaxID=375175 RepID=A0A192H174_9LACO|nr:tyrosine-protein phosphatase [Loigolactobacillus backii]ANK62033.1 protein tyrosine phosphatase [Loigolactobacillus backii]ANK68773.1 protein tyrosine phosphatase [Loigolactobacillus backii]
MQQQRVLQLDGGVNFRELGGYETINRCQVKWQKILRSGSLRDLTAKDLAFLKQYGLHYDIDLRSAGEIDMFPDRLPDTTNYEAAPVYPFTDQNSLQGLNVELADSSFGFFSQTYQQMIVDPHAQLAWRKLFAAMLATPTDKKSVVFHCAAGKDRTGAGAMLVLAALQVKPEIIKRDYLLTNMIFSTDNVNSIDQIVAKNASEDMTNRMNQVLTVEDANFDAVFATIKALSGDTEHYLQNELKFSRQDIKDLRRLYLTD